ncbi:cation diffusion facilitator family transporter [Helicobacter sp. 23-1044]
MNRLIHKNALLIVGFCAFCLMCLKLIVAIFSGSVAIMASAIDSLLDMFVSLFNYFTYKKARSTSTAHFNYGFGKLEGVAALFEGALICASGAYIIYQSLQKFIAKSEISALTHSIFIMLISIFATLGIICFLKFIARSDKSIILKSEILHYKVDLLSNLAVIFSLMLVFVTQIYAFDAIIGGILGIYICAQSYKIAKDGFFILLDRAVDESLQDEILAILGKNSCISSFHDFKTRQSGGFIFVEYHLVFDKEITLFKAHEISDAIEAQIRGISADYEWVILVHLDPYDDSV